MTMPSAMHLSPSPGRPGEGSYPRAPNPDTMPDQPNATPVKKKKWKRT